MTFRSYLLFMCIGTAISLGAWLFVIFNLNPFEAGFVGAALFAVTLGLALVGSLSLLGVGYRVYLRKRTDVISREVKTSFRQAILLALLTVLGLLLAAHGLLRAWVLVLCIGIASLIECLALKIQQSRRD